MSSFPGLMPGLGDLPEESFDRNGKRKGKTGFISGGLVENRLARSNAVERKSFPFLGFAVTMWVKRLQNETI